MPSQSDSVRRYVEQDVMNKTAGELLMLLYETGERACKQRDRQMAIGVFVELLGGVDLRGEDVTNGLIKLYDFALRQVRENKFEFAGQVCHELADAYRTIIETQAPQPDGAHS